MAPEIQMLTHAWQLL